MRSISSVVNTPQKETVQVVYKGETFTATEEDVRYIMLQTLEGVYKPGEFQFIDPSANGKSLLVVMEDGGLNKDFTCNILSFNRELMRRLL